MMLVRNSKKLLLSGAAGLSLWWAGCGLSSVDNGGSTGTEVSAVAGTVLDRGGNPVENAVVRLRPADFLSDSAASESYAATHSLFDTITGSDGAFAFDELLPDSYTVEVICNDTLGSLAGLRIGREQPQVTLPPLTAVPLAQLTGNAQVSYGANTSIFIQVYGLERSARVDDFGNFSLQVPCGYPMERHQLHIGARYSDTSISGEFDGLDVSLDVAPGQQREIGFFPLTPPPPPPCTDGSCDSAVVRFLLSITGNSDVALASVTGIEGGRIVELNLRGKDLSGIMPFDINRLVELRLLDLGQTGLMCIFPDMGRMTKLEVVRLDGNSIPFFATMAGNLQTLRELDLSGNELTALPLSIINCSNIISLNVSDNRLCTVDSSMTAWIDRFDPDWRTDQRCQ